METDIAEESQKLAANHRTKEEMQKTISQIKTSVSEKSARLVSNDLQYPHLSNHPRILEAHHVNMKGTCEYKWFKTCT